jgi:hypothetical protein
VVRDRRDTGSLGPPAELLRYVESDWSGAPNPLEDPLWAKGRPAIRWAAARRRWITTYVSSREQFDRLFFAADVQFPDGFDVRSDYDVSCVMTGFPRWRSDYQWAVKGP